MLTVRIFGIEATLKDLSGMGITQPQLVAGLKRWALYSLEPEIQKNLAGRVLHRRTGHMAARIALPIVKTKGGASVTIQTRGVPYAFIHEYGGEITPVKAKALTVPLKAALTPAGVLRKTAREWKDTWLHITDDNNALICHETPSGDVEPLFILKRKVVIKASAWASKAVMATLDDLDKEIGDLVDEGTKGKSK